MTRRDVLRTAGAASLPVSAAGAAAPPLDVLREGWKNPPRSYRPHTRWWWFGSAVTKEGVTWQLEQMKQAGMGGVEIICAWEVYEKGNIPYLSEAWFDVVRHAIDKAASLDMEVALTFGPGWDLGGFWVPPDERSKTLAPAWFETEGPALLEQTLPIYDVSKVQKTGLLQYFTEPEGNPPDQHQIVAVVAGRLDGGRIDPSSLTDLTAQVKQGRLRWQTPSGRWRVYTFRLLYTGQQSSSQNYTPKNFNADHFSERAMRRYSEYLVEALRKGLGNRLGRVVDTFFIDSFEVVPFPNTILWSNGVLAGFRTAMGYDLTPLLPALWHDIGPETPRIRYDINRYLHDLALETVFKTLRETIAKVGVEARIQPHYRMTEEIIQGAGASPRPETEVTTARFEVVADPRKATAAGARFYGRKIVSAEAYTFIHQERYRTTLEEMKIATDSFLRDGVTQFYNHGYLYSPERDVAPSRDVPWAERISHWNPWWPYYKHLAAYIARAAFLCRWGRFVGDVLLYTPQAEVWCRRAIWGIERRVMPYGRLPKTLVANGYDFDPVNDDVLQNHAKFEKGLARVRENEYRFLIFQRARVVPAATLRAVLRFAEAGGVVIALEDLPSVDPGRKGDDEEVRALVKRIFNARPNAHFIPEFKFKDVPFTSQEKPYEKTPPLDAGDRKLLDTLLHYAIPDFSLDGGRQSDGLTFLHRRDGGIDVYFVANMQPERAVETVTFRTPARMVERWDPLTGRIEPAKVTSATRRETGIRVEMEPWESAFFVFRPGPLPVIGEPPAAGAPPKPLELKGPWRLTVQGVRFPKVERTLSSASYWTDDPELLHCSGTGAYEIDFDLPAVYVNYKGPLKLDLGRVCHVAEAELNGKPLGVRFMQPYRFDIRPAARPGKNRLVVKVTNVLINHVTGLKEPPPIPEHLRAHYGEKEKYAPGLAVFLKRDRLFRPLPPGGMAGPVRIVG